MYYRLIQPIRDREKYSDDLEKILSTDLFYLIWTGVIDERTKCPKCKSYNIEQI